MFHFCLTFYSLLLSLQTHIFVINQTLFFSFNEQGFSFQIGYCEVDDQLPGRSIPQYTLYLTVANEKERLDWIRALRAGEWIEWFNYIEKFWVLWMLSAIETEIAEETDICKHFCWQKMPIVCEIGILAIGRLYCCHSQMNYHLMHMQMMAPAIKFKWFAFLTCCNIDKMKENFFVLRHVHSIDMLEANVTKKILIWVYFKSFNGKS